MKNVEDVNCTASFPVVSVCIEVMEGLDFNFCGGHASGRYQNLYSSSVVNCFSLVFIARGNRKKGETMSCDSPVHCPLFFLQALVDWFGWVPLTGLSWLPSRLTCGTFQFHHAPSPHPSIANGLIWLNALQAAASISNRIWGNLGLQHILQHYHFANVAMLLLHFLLPALPSLWVLFGKYLHISPLKVSVRQCLVGATHRVVMASFQTPLQLPSVSPGFPHLSFVNGFNLQI